MLSNKDMGLFLERGDSVIHSTKPSLKYVARIVNNETWLFRQNGKAEKEEPVRFIDFDFKGFTIRKKRGRKFKK